MTRRALASCGCAGALALLALSSARAEEPREADLLPKSETLGARHNELTTEVVSYLMFREDDAHFRGGFAIEFAPWIFRGAQETRLALFQSWTLGSWGDDRSETVTYEAGAKLRFSLFPRELVDLYPLVSAAWLYDFQGADHMGVRTDAGFGFRVYRAISGELTSEILQVVGGPERERPVFGFGTVVGFDLCSLVTWCDYAPLEQRRDEKTCLLYDEANALCREMGAGETRAPFCAAVDAALNPRKHPPDIGADPMQDFLDALVAELEARRGDTPDLAELTAKVAPLAELHRCFLRWRETGRTRERLAAQRDRIMRVRRVYAPYPTEIKRAFGCGEQHTCEDVCDERPSGPPACVKVQR